RIRGTMADTGSRRLHVRIAAAILAAVIVAFVVFTYLAYSAAFVRTDTVTVTAPRAGLVMERGAKVKYRGLQVGQVDDIEYTGDDAKLTLAINRDQMRFIPSNAQDRKSTRLNSSHVKISYAVFCLKKKNKIINRICS